MFKFDGFPFPVKIGKDVTEEGDSLYFHFRYQKSLNPDQKKRAEEELEKWYSNVFDVTPALVNYMADPKWYTKNTLLTVWLDTGGNDPALTPHLNKLIRKLNKVSPLKEVNIRAY